MTRELWKFYSPRSRRAGRYRRCMRDIVFSTDRLSCRPWLDADVEWYLGAIDEEILRWTREPGNLTREDWMAARHRTAAGDSVRTAAVVDDHGELAGNLGVRRLEDGVELFYWIARDKRGSGYATELLIGAEAWAVSSLGVDRLELQIHPANESSTRVAERAGFEFVGLRRTCDTCADELGRVAIYAKVA